MIRNHRHTTLASSVLSANQIDAVAGGVIQRPDGGTCTDPIIPLGPWIPIPTVPIENY
jgi:hypothetical protein